MTATVISFEPQLKGPSEIPANEITRIIFDNSPEGLHLGPKVHARRQV